MKEAQKTRNIRSKNFYESFMGGTVLDIGAGDDLCVPRARRFDKEDGDANHILDYFPKESFDCVHSSHCLEHIYNPKKSLSDWWKLVRSQGFLITVVPHEDLYEQKKWPSLFNGDHKHTFRFKKNESWSPVSYDIFELVSSLPGAKIISAQIQDRGYIYGKQRFNFSNNILIRKFFTKIQGLFIRFKKANRNFFLYWLLVHAALFFGVPIDQTLGSALAQIEIVAQKIE
jgi:SAM-dependent methyltransferase